MSHANVQISTLSTRPPKRPVDVKWGTCEYVHGPVLMKN